MGTRFSTYHPHDHAEDGEEYVLVDARAVLLDLTDEPVRHARPLRGSQPPAPTAACDPEIEWRAFLGAVRTAEAGDTTGDSVWHRVTRRLQRAWGGARTGKARGE